MDFLRGDIVHILIAFFIIIVSGMILIRLMKRKHGFFGNEKISSFPTEGKRKLLSLGMIAGALILLIISLLGPVTHGVGNGGKIQGIDIVWILDTSKSMDAEDMADETRTASRLSWSRKFMERFMAENSQNRYGLVIFAGNARIISPLTTDSAILASFLKSVHSGIIPQGGTNIEQALELAQSLSSSGENPKHFILLTDGGEDMVEIGAVKGTASLVTIGVGSSKGSPIPVGTDFFGNTIYKKYRGEEVITQLNSDTLEPLTKEAGGTYLDAGSKTLNRLENTLQKSKRHTIDAYSAGILDLSRYISFGAFLLFIGSYIINAPKRAGKNI